MSCPSCGRALPIGFPGATLSCECGALAEVPRSSSVPPEPSGPYRSLAGVREAPEPTTSCPYCGNRVDALVRICPHCDVRLEATRCTRCFSLQVPGSFACGRCGQPMELEPFLDATDAPCPRCRRPLESAPGGASFASTHECPHCGGIFVSREGLAEILCRAELGGPLSGVPIPRSRSVLDPVTYVPCPQCHAQMNRTNFGKVSGVIVDVCSRHGTWFDAGELTRVVAFAAAGGLEKTRTRERSEQPKAPRTAPDAADLPTLDGRLAEWSEFLVGILRW